MSEAARNRPDVVSGTRAAPSSSSTTNRVHTSGTGLVRAAAPLRQQVVEALRGSILDGRFAPGDRLKERVLCDELQVSRTVVREALRQLETEHLVVLVPNVGPVVRSLTLEEIRALYEVRAVLESAASRLAAEHSTPELVARIDASLERIESTPSAEIHALLLAKDEYVAVLVDGSRNVVIGEMLRSIHARVSQLRALTMRSPGRLPNTITELRALRDAVAAGDGDAAADAARRHVEAAAVIALRDFEGAR